MPCHEVNANAMMAPSGYRNSDVFKGAPSEYLNSDVFKGAPSGFLNLDVFKGAWSNSGLMTMKLFYWLPELIKKKHGSTPFINIIKKHAGF